MNNKIEVLAPCGSMDILKTAINAGCDACYLGGPKFGARAYATNFNAETLLEAINYAHCRQSKVYLTVNTLFKNQEISQLYEYIEPLYQEGLDAVIVQDFGAFNFLHSNFPDLDIHCSTQMNITSVLATKYVEKLGAKRIVLPREITINEIKNIKQNSSIELEAFVHGALCFSYSGQCLMSSLAGGRSGNRGRCAQTCRKIYDGQYKLSLKDISIISRLPEIIDAGVTSLKIEGRMKNEYYTAVTVNSYKEALDDINNNCFSKTKAKELEIKMANIFNRGGFCSGYYFGKPNNMLTTKRPNNQGVEIGILTKIIGCKIYIKLSKNINKGDIIEISLVNHTYIELTSNIDANESTEVSLNASKIGSIVIGQKVFRIKSNKLIEELSNNIINNPKKLEIDGKISLIPFNGARLEVWLKDNKEVKVSYECGIVEIAQNKPLDNKSIITKISKLGDTPFKLSNLEIEMLDNSFIPISMLNELRRDTILLLENALIHKNKRKYFDRINTRVDTNITNNECNNNKYNQVIVASCLNYEQFEVLLNSNFISEIYIDLFNNKTNQFLEFEICKELIEKANNKGKKLLIQMPLVLRDKDIDLLKNKMDILQLFDGYFVSNIDCLIFVKQYLKTSNIKIVIGSSLYSYNNHSIDHFTDDNVEFEYPKELNLKELKHLHIKHGQFKIYGYERVMVTAQCFNKSFSKCNTSNKNHSKITDDMKNSYYIFNYCEMCYNIIFNGKPISLHNKIAGNKFLDDKVLRLDFTIENKEATQKIIDLFVDNIIHNKNAEVDYQYTTGHYYRGVE